MFSLACSNITKQCMLQVALLCGLNDDAKKSLLKGPAQGGAHLHKLLKFLTVRSEIGDKRSGITLLGGTVNPLVDGNPGRYCRTAFH